MSSDSEESSENTKLNTKFTPKKTIAVAQKTVGNAKKTVTVQKPIQEEKTIETHEEARKAERPNIGDIIEKRYKVIKQLGEGGFGIVMKIHDLKHKEDFAMKVELEIPPPDETGLSLENAVLKRLQGYKHILRFIDEGKWQNHTFLVMQLAGHNLGDLRKHCPEKRFTNYTTVRIGYQCLDAIETVHVGGFLHRDVKPANFAMGFLEQDKKTVFILDFGLVRRFRLQNGKIRPQRKRAAFRGSYQFASVNAHQNKDLGRRDDIWSWMYSVVQMRLGKLPWRKMNGKDKVGNRKLNVKKEELLEDMEPEFHQIYDNLATLEYADEPSYGMYRDLMTNIFKRKNYSHDAPLDWEEGGEHFKHTIYLKPQPYAEQLKHCLKRQPKPTKK